MPDIGNNEELKNCRFGPYCMCYTCTFQEECENCLDCVRHWSRIHDVWSCTKYERKGELR